MLGQERRLGVESRMSKDGQRTSQNNVEWVSLNYAPLIPFKRRGATTVDRMDGNPVSKKEYPATDS